MNVVKFILEGVDQTGPATAGVKRLSAEMKGMSQVFNQAGILAATFGSQQLASVVNGIEGSVIATRQMTQELGKSKLAMVGLAAVAATLGASLAGPIGDLIWGPGEKKRSDQIAFLETVSGAMHERLALFSAEVAKSEEINRSIDERIRLMLNLKNVSVMDRASGVSALERLREAHRVKAVRDAFEEIRAVHKNADEVYMSAQKAVADFQQRQRSEKFDKDQALLDRQIESIQRFREQEMAGAMAAADLQGEMRIATLDGYAQVSAALDLDYEKRLQQIAQLQLSEEQSIQLSLQAYEEYTKRKKLLNQQAWQSGSEMFGNLAQAAKAFGKKGMAAYKAFASAQALINTYSSAVAAYNAMAGIPIVGPALAVAAAAAAIAAGLANVAQINSTSVNVAHGGIGYVPRESTYLLDEGERVVQRDQNADLGQFLKEQRFGGGGGRGGMMRVVVMLSERVLLDTVAEASRDGRIEIDGRAVSR